uniref:Uncharacterized protein n=1 Tax=Oryza rufipogon TaxID=4529 RepID=A0A0E0NDZ5_ORYRU
MWAARAPHLGSTPLRASDRARQGLHASVHTAVRSIHTASAGLRVSPSAPHHPLLIHAPPPPPLHALAPLLLLPPRVGVAAPPSERQSWPSLPSSARQQPVPPALPAEPPPRQVRWLDTYTIDCDSLLFGHLPVGDLVLNQRQSHLLGRSEWQKAADLDGEGVAEEVREASDGCEHRALDKLPRSLESLSQVLFLFIIIVTHAPSLGSTDGGQTRRVSSSSRGGGGSEGGFRDRIDGQLAAEMWVRWRRRKEERAGMKAKKHSRHGYPKLRPDRVACEPWFPSCYHRGGGDGVDTSQRRG